MKNAKLLFVGGVVAVLLIWVLYTKYQNQGGVMPSKSGESTGNLVATPIPQPTSIPQSMKITAIDKLYIYLQSDKGKLRLSNSSSKVQVFKTINGQLVASTLSSLSVGQNVSVISIVPGKASQVIIEK